MKIAVFSAKSYDKDFLLQANRSYGYELEFFEAPLNRKTAGLSAGFEVVCAFVNDQINRETLEQLSRHHIRLVALRCAGFNNVDLEAAASLGITVLRVPAYSPHAVAEHAVALIMALSRKTHKAYNRVREANFSLDRLVGINIHGKTVGVYGTGKIGQVFAGLMQGFGCRVLAYDPYPSEELRKRGVDYVDSGELFSRSDILSLHCPLTPETYRIVNSTTLEQMKKGAMLINTSRGKLIDTQEVIAALRSKHLGYLGMDVYAEEERLFFRDLSEMIIDDEMIMQLMTFPNVLITAHQAFLTHEALTEIAHTTMENIRTFEQGLKSTNEVTLANVH
ncbi:MAG: 2-hydroxyacid dehydrogenase [Bacteroidota bacterium]